MYSGVAMSPVNNSKNHCKKRFSVFNKRPGEPFGEEEEQMDCLVQFCHSRLHLQHQQSEPKIEDSITIASFLFMFAYMHEKVRHIYIIFCRDFAD